MIPLKQLRDNKTAILEGLQRRNFKELELVDALLSLDQKRRKTQTELDSQLAEANQLAKEISQLFKSWNGNYFPFENHLIDTFCLFLSIQFLSSEWLWSLHSNDSFLF